jgi:hypothetical protein
MSEAPVGTPSTTATGIAKVPVVPLTDEEAAKYHRLLDSREAAEVLAARTQIDLQRFVGEMREKHGKLISINGAEYQIMSCPAGGYLRRR